MEIAKDLIASLRGRLGQPLSDPADAGLIWPDLHARFTAAHAAAGEMARAEAFPAGSFEQWNSAGGKASRSVNRTDLADGKSTQGIDAAIADQSNIGGRGQ